MKKTLPKKRIEMHTIETEIRGIVVRMSDVKLLEMIREFECPKCRITIYKDANYSFMYQFEIPKCSRKGCR